MLPTLNNRMSKHTRWLQGQISAWLDEGLIELKPGEAYTVELDLSESRWHVMVDGNAGEIGRYANNDSFRIVYRSPEASSDWLSLAGDKAWRGDLSSSAFTAFRILD